MTQVIRLSPNIIVEVDDGYIVAASLVEPAPNLHVVGSEPRGERIRLVEIWTARGDQPAPERAV